ncbi:hypothetical protein B0T26DRAFT_742954 [Lasiosphaeria miniovina]|uniref:CID domain-containing protein n=1 Tax=Lasiosphaeria miniovina TaxID=1954250 RepID=A0AA40DMV3_9PEZI|nr:uncharacterized protein B0T26DRAFT_742954 [Lasiosphaeria miniovina]KAK0709549.1 hypothetical protein B0T26DRAFT_742954 [Lasiosphaeria miniovina]
MSSRKKITEFPDAEAKLQRPVKQSAFERQKAEAEAKRRREEAETAAALESFRETFGDDDSFRSSARDSKPPPSRLTDGFPNKPPLGASTGYGGGSGKRHFGVPSGPTMKSGPGSLGPVPSSLGKKRPFEGFQSRDEGRGRLGLSSWDSRSRTDENAPVADRAQEKAISKPTLRLANIPLNTSLSAIKALVPSNLTVDDVKIIPPSGPSGTERKSNTAIVILSQETPAKDIDAAASVLQNRYLGFGFFLSAQKYLSSAAISSSLPISVSSGPSSHPFGAKRVEPSVKTHLSQPIGHGRAYAPPSSYGPASASVDRNDLLHVPTRPPGDIKQLRMIHKVIESVLERGAEFEALLMSRPEVQREEKWAWIWDARSEGGIWYRWRLWDIITGFWSRRRVDKYVPLFERSHAWKVPDERLPYEYATGVDEFVSDPDYNSLDEDDFEPDKPRQNETGSGSKTKDDTFLNPIDKSRLAYLLARLPTTLSKIKNGDIASVSAFALAHTSKGADEVAEMVVSNIERPLAFTSANPKCKKDSKGKDGDGEDSRHVSPAAEDKAASDATDIRESRLIGLYVVSDILELSGNKNLAWRFRQLLETALRKHKTFEMLGMMADKFNFGLMRANNWKNSIEYVLSIWDGKNIFPEETQAFFYSSFKNPPSVKKDTSGGETGKTTSRWKSVTRSTAEGGKASAISAASNLPASYLEPANGSGRADRMLDTGETDREPQLSQVQYSFGAGELLSEDDIDGEAHEGPTDHDAVMGGLDETPVARPLTTKPEVKSVGGFKMSSFKAAVPRKRIRAVDMFAGSGSDEDH